MPPGLNLPDINSPTVAMRTNPIDPYSKILIVAGGDSNQVLQAAQAVALHSDMLAGAQATIDSPRLPNKQQPDAAPRWARTDQHIALWDYATAEQLQGDGTAPLSVYFRVPPDIYYTAREPNAILRLVYRYNSIPIGPISSTQMRINNAFLGSIPLIPWPGSVKRECRWTSLFQWSICARFLTRSPSISPSSCSKRAAARTPPPSTCRPPSCAIPTLT